MKLTGQELEILRLTAEIYNLASKLPRQHPSDMEELAREIHSIQNRVMARLSARAHPEIFGDYDA